MCTKRLTQADALLHLVRNVLLDEIRGDKEDLTLRQLAIKLTVYPTDQP